MHYLIRAAMQVGANMKIKQLTRLVFTRNYKSLAPLFIMSLFSSVIFNLLLPNLNGEYFDELTRGAEHRLYTVLFYLLIVNAGGLVLSFFLSLLNSVAGSRVALKVNFEVIEHIQKTPLEYSNKINPVFVTQQVNNDSHVVTDFFLDFLIQGFVSLFDFNINGCFNVQNQYIDWCIVLIGCTCLCGCLFYVQEAYLPECLSHEK